MDLDIDLDHLFEDQPVVVLKPTNVLEIYYYILIQIVLPFVQ